MRTIRLATGFVAAVAAVLSVPAGAETGERDAFRERLSIAQGRLAVELVQRLSTPDKMMAATSPASIAGAAVALDLGASKELRDALHAVLGFRKGADVPADLAALRGRVQALNAGEKPVPALKFATAVLFDQKVNPYPGVALAFKQAAVDHAVLDFSSADSADKINARVREQTGGMIPEIVDRGPTGASLLVLNALHFKDKWKTPFDRADTKPEPFKRVGGQTVTVSTMHLPEGRYRFRQDARFTGIELPYSDPRFSMVVVTTRGERPAPVRTFRGASDWLSGKGFAEGPGELALPHFAVSAREDLTRPLDALGLREARLMPGALPGFTADPARITRLVQRIELRVNEEGTEASAATAVMAERGVDPNYVKMVVDKPFMFALRDNTTGLILIAGYVGQPSALATAAQ